jgi:hypothetical protein
MECRLSYALKHAKGEAAFDLASKAFDGIQGSVHSRSESAILRR